MNSFQAKQVKYKISDGIFKGSKIPFDIQPEISPKYKFQKVSDQEIDANDEEIKKLKQKIVKKEVHHEYEEFICPIFVSPKKDGIYKLILNLKDLNQYIE